MIANVLAALASFFKSLADRVATFFAGYFAGRLAKDKAAAEERAGRLDKEAEAWRGRPRNGADLARRLFELAKRKSGGH